MRNSDQTNPNWHLEATLEAETRYWDSCYSQIVDRLLDFRSRVKSPHLDQLHDWFDLQCRLTQRHEYGCRPLELEQKSKILALNERIQNVAEKPIRDEQSDFRRAAIDRYQGQCLISGFDELDCLEAAHIMPVSLGGPYIAENGLLLRSDLHRLFDSGKISIRDGVGVVSSTLSSNVVRGLVQRPIAVKSDSLSYLNWHLKNVFKGC